MGFFLHPAYQYCVSRLMGRRLDQTRSGFVCFLCPGANRKDLCSWVLLLGLGGWCWVTANSFGGMFFLNLAGGERQKTASMPARGTKGRGLVAQGARMSLLPLPVHPGMIQ